MITLEGTISSKLNNNFIHWQLPEPAKPLQIHRFFDLDFGGLVLPGTVTAKIANEDFANVAELPSGIQASSNSVSEQYTGLVATLSVSTGVANSWAIVDGIDAAYFDIQNGNELHIITPVVFGDWRSLEGMSPADLSQYTGSQLEQKSLFVEVRATNNIGNSSPEELEFAITEL